MGTLIEGARIKNLQYISISMIEELILLHISCLLAFR